MSDNFRFNPRTLLLSAFWIKTLGVLGFLIPLQENGYLEEIDTYCGVSTGSLVSLLLILDMNVRDIISIIIDLDILANVSNLFNCSTIFSQKGIVDIDQFRKKLKSVVGSKLGSIPTLEGLKNFTGKSLVVHCLNIKTNEIEIFSPISHPNLSCVDAVINAINIPFIFKQHEDNNLIDSYFSNPYPIDYYDCGEQVLGITMKHKKERSELPFLINSNNISFFDNISKDKIRNLSLYFYELIVSTIEQKQNENFSKVSNNCRTVEIPIKVCDPIGYSLELDDRAEIIIDGYNIGQDYIDEKMVYIINRKRYKYDYPEYLLEEA